MCRFVAHAPTQAYCFEWLKLLFREKNEYISIHKFNIHPPLPAAPPPTTHHRTTLFSSSMSAAQRLEVAHDSNSSSSAGINMDPNHVWKILQKFSTPYCTTPAINFLFSRIGMGALPATSFLCFRTLLKRFKNAACLTTCLVCCLARNEFHNLLNLLFSMRRTFSLLSDFYLYGRSSEKKEEKKIIQVGRSIDGECGFLKMNPINMQCGQEGATGIILVT